jgi:hypothetical protein
VLVRVDWAGHAHTFRAGIAADLVEEIEDGTDFAHRYSLSYRPGSNWVYKDCIESHGAGLIPTGKWR